MKKVPLSSIETFDPETKELNVFIETPQGSRNKFKYDPRRDLFLLHKVLCAGFVFPFDFGFIPSTQGEDGDPLDVLILLDEPVFQGNLVEARLVGVIEANQTEEEKTIRNDRLIAIGARSQDFADIKEIGDLNQSLLDQIEKFFIFYNEAQGRKFEPLGRAGSQQALKLIQEGQKRFQKQSKD